MKQNAIIVSVLALFTALFLLPTFGAAQQRTISITSLNNAYNAQVAMLNADIASSSADMTKNSPTSTTLSYTRTMNIQRLADQSQVANDTRDMHTLQVTYQMMLNALQ